MNLITHSLVQLKDEQGHDLLLVGIKNDTYGVVAGFKYIVNAVFKEAANADHVQCKVTIWEQSWVQFVDFEAQCAQNVYKVVKGKQSN